jgi:DNA mismatch repair ATPase MutS
MKVFLMHRERDFDPKLKLPPNEAELVKDLELKILFEAMARGDKFILAVAKQAVLSSLDDPGAILYRQEILKDCLKNAAVVRQIYQIPLQSIQNKQKHWMGVFSQYPGGILSGAVEMLGMFVGLLKGLKQIADQSAGEFKSEGFQRFFAMVQQELDDEYFAAVEEHLRELKFRDGVLVGAELGPGNEGANYVLRKPNRNNDHWSRRVFSRKSPVYSYTIPSRDDHGARALGELRDKGINLVANAVAQSADHIDGFLNMLRLELAFYIGGLNLSEQLSVLGEPIAFPELAPVHARQHTFTGLYDICLAMTIKKGVVGNDVQADGKNLVMITGANQGGKSTFLRSIGQAQLMMQSGLFVPAKSFSANVCSGLFTHYKREEDTSMKSGKFDEELGRMSVIIDQVSPNSLVLFNESFAATNEREGSEIARQIVNALLEKQIKVFFVTHQYELAHGYHKKPGNVLFLRAERQSDGGRTFRLRKGEPLQTSFGKDLFEKIF